MEHNPTVDELALMANKLRIHSMKSTTAAGSGHPTSCMSAAEIMSILFFRELSADDEFILSKGHAAPILWASFAEAGLVKEEELLTLRKIDSNLEGHPTPNMPLIKVATGSLGQGLSAGVGMALAKRLEESDGRIYVLMGDGECAEGSVWEAANTASYYKLSNLCAIVDANRLGQSEATMHGHDVSAYKKKFEAFGWDSELVDGHNVKKIISVFAKARKSRRPFAVIAKTFKGRGVSFLENKEGWHGKPLREDELEKALAEVGPADVTLHSHVTGRKTDYGTIKFTPNKYKLGDEVATRVAFGNALLNLGRGNRKVVAIDGDVKNSTMLQGFFDEFPDRGFEAFIAEQNMAGMAIGLSAMGYTPFVSTFSTFLTRAHDFIRMAQYSKSNIKFIGSHAGVSIGPDGSSQMGLEDIPMFLSMLNTTVVYPSDAVSTEKLVGEIAKTNGVAYMRTTRGKTPVIYGNNEEFPIGGLKVLRESENDGALIISSGITVHEALKAHDTLKQRGVNVRVIDLYSIKPFDAGALTRHSGECVKSVVVEDHYCYGIGSYVSGMLDNVSHLCVREMPHSGKPWELMEFEGITARHIVKLVEQGK